MSRAVDSRLMNRYCFFVLNVVRARIDLTVKAPRTLHHEGRGVFIVADKTIKLLSKMK